MIENLVSIINVCPSNIFHKICERTRIFQMTVVKFLIEIVLEVAANAATVLLLPNVCKL